MLVGNRVGVGLTRGTISPVLPFPFPVKGTRKLHPCLHPRWKIHPTRISYCSSNSWARSFRCEDNNVAFTHVQTHYYRMWQVEPCNRLGEVARRSSWAVGLLVLYSSKINFTTTACGGWSHISRNVRQLNTFCTKKYWLHFKAEKRYDNWAPYVLHYMKWL